VNPLERLQLDVEHCLLSLQLIDTVTISSVRPRSSAEALGIQTKLDKTLAGLMERNGKKGCAIIVGMPTLNDVNANLRSVKGDLVIELSVIENVMTNEGADGTGFTAEALAFTLAETLPQTNFSPFGQIIADKQLITPKTESVLNKRIEYRVTLRVLSHSAAAVKCSTPTITRSGSTITISGSDAVYYTTDDSYPGPGNATAEIYTVPLTQTAAIRLRAAAFAADKANSDVAFASFAEPV
jgi:hypothetical protein